MTTPEQKNGTARPPIVVVMGHVDHGKTTLIDYIRKTNLVAKEAGGITQSIGAYEIEHSGKRITFIDTPGHQAFTQMRSRGATAADLAILVVAADEGVKPQTAEAIKILNDTKTPFVVAITKIDRPNADIDRIKNDLTTNGVLLEGYGGNVSYQGVSAKSGEGVSELLDFLLLAAELEGLTFDPAAPASGYILEAKKDKSRGIEVVVIVTNGTLKKGDKIVSGQAGGKVKLLENFLGKAVPSLTPSAPAMIIGFEELPQIGDAFSVGGEIMAPDPTALGPQLETHIDQYAERDPLAINLVLKAENSGALEALSSVIQSLKTDKRLIIKTAAVGDVYDNDVQTAISTGSLIIAFRSKTHPSAKRIADINNVKILSSDIIYKLTEELEHLATEHPDIPEGELEVLAVFNQTELDKQLVGGKVVVGFLKNKKTFSVKRGEEVLGQGRITNLQQNKLDANEVPEGKECGLLINSQVLIKAGDHLVVPLK